MSETGLTTIQLKKINKFRFLNQLNYSIKIPALYINLSIYNAGIFIIHSGDEGD